MIVQWSAKLIAGLIANRRPGEVAAGISFGFLLALVPADNLLWPLLFILTFFLKLNMGAEIAALGVFRLSAPLADPLIDALGYAVLTAPALTPFFTTLYQIPLLPLTQFNNSIVMGALVLGLALWLPLFLVARVGVMGFRTHLQPRIAESRLVKTFTRIPLIAKLGHAIRRFHGAYNAFS